MISRLRIVAAGLVTAAVIGFTAGPAVAAAPHDVSQAAQYARAGDPEADGVLGNVVNGVPILGSALRGVTTLLSLLPVVGEIVKPLTGDPLAGISKAVKTLAILALLFPKKS